MKTRATLIAALLALPGAEAHDGTQGCEERTYSAQRSTPPRKRGGAP